MRVASHSHLSPLLLIPLLAGLPIVTFGFRESSGDQHVYIANRGEYSDVGNPRKLDNAPQCCRCGPCSGGSLDGDSAILNLQPHIGRYYPGEGATGLGGADWANGGNSDIDYGSNQPGKPTSSGSGLGSGLNPGGVSWNPFANWGNMASINPLHNWNMLGR